MAREQTDPTQKYWSNYNAIAMHTTKSVHVYVWTCHDCKTVNTTTIDTTNPRSKIRCYRGVEARCGHCHGNTVRLCDSKGLTWDPHDA